MHITLGGFVAGLNGEMDWIKFDDQMFDFVKTFTDNADTALYGRTTWKMIDSYWPTAKLSGLSHSDINIKDLLDKGGH